MDELIGQMKEVAQRHHAHRLCLFGSRARGDNRPDSDYDFALWGVALAEQPFLRDAAEEIPSLMKLDLVFVSEDTDAALLASIEKDGIMLMDRFETKYENFKSALSRLQEGLAGYETATDQEIVRDGVIQRFEFTCELAWKTAREYLLDQGHVDLNSPKAVMKQAFADGLVSDSDGWVSLLTDRNLTSHIYDEGTADQIFEKVRGQYVVLFSELLAKLS